MTQHSPHFRSVLLSTVFALCTACSESAPHAQGFPADPPQSPAAQTVYTLPAAVQNFYLDGQAAQRCSTIDGEGTTSSTVARTVKEISTTLSRFPLGHAAVLDLQKSGTILCFESSSIPDMAPGVERHAEYRRDLNMLRLTDADPWRVIHEWKHKNDDINFNNFFYTPRSAILVLRFAEAGAYTYEVMARNEARSYGVQVGPYPAGQLEQLERVYTEALTRGGTKEQAWRAAFETSFNNGMLGSYTENVLGAYEQAISYTPISQNPNFARTTVSNDGLITIALPPGWGLEAFRRTGTADVSRDIRYVGNTLSQEERLQSLERGLEKKAPPALTPPLSPHN